MEGINYSELVQTVLKRHTANHLSEDTEKELILDKESDRYLLVHVGWENQERVYGCVVHVDIKDGKGRIRCTENGYCFGISSALCSAVYRVCSGLNVDSEGAIA